MVYLTTIFNENLMNYRKELNPDLLRSRRGNLSDFTPIRQLQDINGEQVCICSGTRREAKSCLENNPIPTCPGSTEESNDTTDVTLAKRGCAQDVMNDPSVH